MNSCASAVSSTNVCKNLRSETMLKHRKSIFVTVLLFSVIALPSWVLAEQTNAAEAITSAKAQIVTGYQAARQAEGAGANISSLTATLNDAGALLSQAESAYSQKDFDAARNLAVQSKDMLGNLVSEANALKQTATQQRNQDFLINVVGSIVGAFAVIGAGIAAWLFLKKRYAQNEASANESSRL
jgi:hypothetical protein